MDPKNPEVRGYILLVLLSNPSRHHSNALYRWGVRRGGKTGKHKKSRSKEKVVFFSSASLYTARKWEAVTQGITGGIDHPTRRKTQGTDIVKLMSFTPCYAYP